MKHKIKVTFHYKLNGEDFEWETELYALPRIDDTVFLTDDNDFIGKVKQVSWFFYAGEDEKHDGVIIDLDSEQE